MEVFGQPDTLGKEFPLERRLGGPQRPSGHGGKTEKIPDPTRNLTPGHTDHSLVSILTWLPYLGHA